MKIINLLKSFVDGFYSIFENLSNPYERCYNHMEDTGTAVFGSCSGLAGGSSATEYLSEECVECPHLVLVSRIKEKSKEYKPKIIAVDFDGTLCQNAFPEIGEPNYLMIRKLNECRLRGDKTILWTCRVDEKLQDALDWCDRHHIYFDAVNENLPEIIESFGADTRKIFANEYWDDRNIDIERFI